MLVLNLFCDFVPETPFNQIVWKYDVDGNTRFFFSNNQNANKNPFGINTG